MNKLRSDSVFSQLTPEQVETLEGWLFEENLGYKEALERVQKEFNVQGSLTGLRRFYRRLARERSREDLTEMASVCAEALATTKTDGTLQAGLITLATKVAVELLVQSPEKVREFTALLRAITSAQALEMKRVLFQREEERLREAQLREERKLAEERERIRRWNEEEEARARVREEKRKAKALENIKNQAPSAREATNPKLQTDGVPNPVVDSSVAVRSESGELPKAEKADVVAKSDDVVPKTDVQSVSGSDVQKNAASLAAVVAKVVKLEDWMAAGVVTG